jgi:hypothetical protein
VFFLLGRIRVERGGSRVEGRCLQSACSRVAYLEGRAEPRGLVATGLVVEVAHCLLVSGSLDPLDPRALVSFAPFCRPHNSTGGP